ncbi:penicillin-binding protein [Lysinibacillus sp. 2017]|uniref:transglycosylase domain-containing protein n=1 Tax=unclassified Lysinibacillus TaxID=2636778 RepID=UPI000D526559|nr:MULTISPECIES: PBP1A family penicillin-binding protein [unclassified Lysinibacillus]AWE06258.1 penicillin-binding protein [Lysinibacillus sp. 2017]TGN35266.1 PBP1A family penicillin-binding protein [Lysinibacillus sp. S2017]
MKRQQYIKQKNRKKFSRKLGLLMIGFICAIAVTLLSLRIYAQVAGAPPLTVPKASIFLDSDNNQIGDYFTEERRYWTDLEDISPYLVDATVAVEDKDFYNHGGFDYSRIAGAVLADIKAGSKVQGASTLTQQYARNLYLTHEKTWLRKVNEALFSYRLELFYSKDEILEGYLNTVYYGHGMYGVEAASRYFYGKSAKDLTLSEAAMLAGVPKGPSYYSPLNNLEKATNRQQVILRLMDEQDKITTEEKTRATSEQVVLKSDEWIATKSIAPYFLDVVWDEASDILADKNLSISEGGWTIQTTLNQAHQRAAESAITKNMPNNDLQVGFVSMDADRGFVTALVGGREYSTSSYNRVVLGNRQPGSAIKPILYAAALENDFTPMTFLDVSQTTFTYDRGRATYTPQNINKKYADHEISMAQALAISDNVFAVKTLDEIGYRAFRDTQKRFGLNYSDNDNPSIALGTTENSLYDLTNAYNTIAAGGEKRQATTILSIKDAKGNTVYKYEEPKEKEQVISKEDASVLTQMMTGMFDPVYSDYSPATGLSLRPRMSHTYAAKSGTTNSDQWMIGFTPGLTAGVWNGYDQGKTLSVQADMAASKQVWIDFMETALDGKANESFPIPKGVEAVTVDINSGKLANKSCTNQRVIYLKTKDVPTESCSTFDFFDTDSWSSVWEKVPFEALRSFWD